jgi:hypothetical protein
VVLRRLRGRADDVRGGTAVGGARAAVGADLAVILEDDHSVAEQAPALLGKASDDASGVVVTRVSGGTGRLVLAHLDSELGVFSILGRSCALTHMTKNARYSVERRSFERVTLKLIQIRLFG